MPSLQQNSWECITQIADRCGSDLGALQTCIDPGAFGTERPYKGHFLEHAKTFSKDNIGAQGDTN
jgi:hypothetical protein